MWDITLKFNLPVPASVLFSDGLVMVSLAVDRRFCWWDEDKFCWGNPKRPHCLPIENVLTHEMLHAIIFKVTGDITPAFDNMLKKCFPTNSQLIKFYLECVGIFHDARRKIST